MASRPRRDAGLYFREPVEIGAQDGALEDEAGELAFAQDLDQAGGFAFLDVLGERRGADAVARAQHAARARGGGCRALLDDPHPARAVAPPPTAPQPPRAQRIET